jgi:hypothetical protein
MLAEGVGQLAKIRLGTVETLASGPGAYVLSGTSVNWFSEDWKLAETQKNLGKLGALAT